MKTIHRHLFRIAPFGLLLAAGTAEAQTSGTIGSNISTFLTFIDSYLVPLIFGIALVAFLWGVFQYFIAGGGNDEKRTEGRTFILYGVIGFVIMTSVWGIVNLINGSFSFGSTTRPGLPCFDQSNCQSSGTTDSSGTDTSGDFGSGSGLGNAQFPSQ